MNRAGNVLKVNIDGWMIDHCSKSGISFSRIAAGKLNEIWYPHYMSNSRKFINFLHLSWYRVV